MAKVDLEIALTCQTLKGWEPCWHRPARISTWTPISVMSIHLTKFDVLAAKCVIVTGGVEAGSPDPRTALEKQAVGHEPHRHPLAFVGRSTLLL